MKRVYFGKNAAFGFLIIALAFLSIIFGFSQVPAQELRVINLPPVNKDRGDSLMTALSNRASADSLSDRDLGLQDLSDLLWAAAGINRADIEKRTFPTAMNTQDTAVYLLMKDGVYVYDHENHALKPVNSGDYRMSIALQMGGGGAPPSEAARSGGPGGAPKGSTGGPSAGAGESDRKRISTFAFSIILVSDPSQYPVGTDDLKNEWGTFSVGCVAQNIMLFCSANNLGTRPRAAFDKDMVKKILKLTDTQNPIIELPVGYPE